MRELGGEALLAWEGGAIGVRKRAAGRDDPSGLQLLALSRDDHELTVFLADGHHAGVGLDLDVERGSAALKVIGHLVTGGVAAWVARERHPEHGAEAGGRECPQAVVVARPRPRRAIPGLEDHR